MRLLRIMTAAAAIGALGLGPAGAGGFDLNWYTIDGGGGMFNAGGAFELSGTIGQPDAGVMTGDSFELVGGFWGVAASPGTGAPAAGDCDADGDVDLDDYVDFPDCLSGPGVPHAGEPCACLDFDGNGVIDLADFAAFQAAAGG